MYFAQMQAFKTNSKIVPGKRKKKKVEGKKNRTLSESEWDKGESALQGKTIPSVFVTGAKTVQSPH